MYCRRRRALKVLFESKHSGNLVSLVAPYDLTAKPLFKWSNPFSWSYNGDVADSIKERVKAAGGNVTGDICCRLAWFNHDDLDFHMHESPGDHIYYGHKRSRRGGELDVDMNAGGGTTRKPVENIVYRQKPTTGVYTLSVHQFCKRESRDTGFEVEIDVLGQLYMYTFDNVMTQGKTVKVATITVKEDGSVTVDGPIAKAQTSKTIWNVNTLMFHRVTAIMLSPNCWSNSHSDNDARAIGNKHYFFMLDGCQNDGSARGFYNEFLSNELEPHRKTMELVGSKMRTEESGDQMSGLGFSSTQRNSVTVRVSGSFQRTLKVTF